MNDVAISAQVEAAVQAALDQVLPVELAGADPVVRRSDRADYQANGALAVAKKVGRPPQDVAEDLVAHLDGCAAEVSGPGFVNITVPADVVWSAVAARLTDARLGVGLPCSGQRVVVDYCGPNVAKEMHVGHLRSSVIGDALVRVLSYLGAHVIRQNHVGDWGTQFGMLIEHLHDHPGTDWAAHGAQTMSALDALYKAARARFETDPAFADRSRARVVALQAGDQSGWLPPFVDAEHVAFGTVLGTDGRPFKTRSGQTVRLVDLLDEAEAAVRTVLDDKDHGLDDDELDVVVAAAATAAIKYADLSSTRTKDHVLDIDQMVATNGDTGVYLQYAHARIASILCKADQVGHVDTTLAMHPAERALALTLDAFGATRTTSLRASNHTVCASTSTRWQPCSPSSTWLALCSRPRPRRHERTGSPCAS